MNGYNLEDGRQLWLTASATICDKDTLWDEVRQFVFSHVELPETELYDVVTSWILCTWITDKFPVTPYIKAIAPAASGKTRLLDVLYYLSYRGVKSSNTSTPIIYRILEKWKVTIILDEIEQYKNDDDMIGILNAGYKKGDYAMRVIDARNNELGLYQTLGFKALGGTERLKDTTESRCININMQKAIRPVRFTVDEAWATELRNKLLYSSLNILNELNDLNDLPDELRFSSGRFAELYSPLVHVAKFFGKEKGVIDYANTVWQAYQDEEEVSIEAQVLIAVLRLKESELQGIPLRFSTTDVTRYFNMYREAREYWKPSSVGRVLTRLGFRPKRLGNGRKGYLWEGTRINRLKRRYNIE